MPFDNPDPWRPDPPPSFLVKLTTAILCAIWLTLVVAVIAVVWAMIAPIWLGVKITEAAAWCARRLRI
jgi:hypothetical protein